MRTEDIDRLGPSACGPMVIQPTDVPVPVRQVQRLRRARTKGYRMPEGAVYVGRPTRWGNPFSIEKHGRIAALEYFRLYLTGHFELVPRHAHREYRAAEKRLYGRCPAALFPGEIAAIFLRGRDLACWCPLDQPCHADVLLDVANR
jgi:hypothetical protein